MRTIPLQFRSTVQAARDLVSRLKIRSPDEIDVELIASHCGALVQFARLTHEDGQLIRVGDTGIIVVDERTRASAKWRFVAAHELGHLLAHRDVDQLRVCTDTDLHEWYTSAGHEPAANHFAAELLMPESLFKRKCDRNRPSLHDVRELANNFRTSMMATALRFVDYCPEPVAVAFSCNGTIEWWLKSDDFQFWLKKGRRLDGRTYAGDLASGRPVDDRPSVVGAEGWSDDSRAVDFEVQEHSVRLGAHGVLSLLWHEYQ